MFVARTVAAAHVVVVDERASIFVGQRRVLVIAAIALVSGTGVLRGLTLPPRQRGCGDPGH
jgi:hypothetical protein